MALNSDTDFVAKEALIFRRGRFPDMYPVLEIERAAFGRHAMDPTNLFFLLLRRWPGFIIAEQEHRLVGYVIARLAGFPWQKKRGGIISIAIHPSQLRRGIGRRLMEAALEFFRNAGAIAVDLEVDVKNIPAIALYENLGFKAAKSLPNYYGPGQNGLRMTLDFPLPDGR